MKKVQKMVEDSWSDHKTGVDGTPNNTAQGVPCSVVKPIVKFVKSFFRQEFCSSVVEVRIEFMDHNFIPENGK